MPVGPTMLRPGPMLLMQAMTLVKVVTPSKLSSDTIRAEIPRMQK